MPLHKFGDVAPSEHAERAFITGGGLARDCHCGRVHFDDDERAGTWDPGELENYREKEKADPEKYIANRGVTDATINGQVYVIGCPCNGLRRYEDFLWDHRGQIAGYLRARAADELRAAQFNAALVEGIAP